MFLLIMMEILKTDNQKEVFKSYVKHKGDFFVMSEDLGKTVATLKDTWKRIEEINKKERNDYIAEMRKKLK